jgi:periplasmic protein TonB
MEEARTRSTMKDRIAFKQLVPLTASMLIHAGILGAVILGPGWAPIDMPVLIAELVEAEAPPAVEPPPAAPRPIVRDRRPITPPKPISAPLPLEPPAPARPAPEPPKARANEPPPAVAQEPAAVATPAPEVAKPTVGEPMRAPTPPAPEGLSGAVTGPSVSATSEPDPGPGAFAAPAPTPAPQAPAVGAPSSSARGAAVAAIPPDGVTQRAIPRGGYQYRPAYPSSARNLGIQGTTLLQVLVSDSGRVAEVVVKQSAGHPDLDRAAADAVRRWRFEPARRGRDPVEMWVQLPFEFRLR